MASPLVCIGLYLVGTAIHPVAHFAGALAVRAVVLLAVVAVFAAVRERVLQLEHSAEELEAIRMALTPPSMPAASPASTSPRPSSPPSSASPATSTCSPTVPDGSTIAVVGDVVGHGPKAARLATFVRAQIATFAANSSDPAEILTMTNAALLERPGRGEELVSAVCLRFHSESRAPLLGGRRPPAAARAARAAGHSDSPGETLLLGVDDGLSLTTAEAPLGDEDGVLVYTDGATDVRIEEGSMLGLEGLRRLLAPVADLPAEPLVGEIEETLLDWAHGAIKDDICVLVLRPTGA